MGNQPISTRHTQIGQTMWTHTTWNYQCSSCTLEKSSGQLYMGKPLYQQLWSSRPHSYPMMNCQRPWWEMQQTYEHKQPVCCRTQWWFLAHLHIPRRIYYHPRKLRWVWWPYLLHQYYLTHQKANATSWHPQNTIPQQWTCTMPQQLCQGCPVYLKLTIRSRQS